MRSCIVCGASSPEGTSTCAGCGADLRPTVRGTARRRGAGKEQDPPGATGLVPEPGLWTQSKIGRRQPSTKTGERHFLVPPFGDALRLESGPPLTLGRDKDCEIRINSPTVSRRHAQVSFRGSPPRAFVKDLGTRNGTYVNGERLASDRELADRDLVRLGDVTAVYRFLGRGASESTLQDTAGSSPTDLNQTMAIDEDDTAPGVNGDVALVPLPDLLGRLASTRASGELVVEVDATVGRATFVDGRATDVLFGGLENDAALRAISELKRGKFRFLPAGESAR